jgi:ribosomal protein S18
MCVPIAGLAGAQLVTAQIALAGLAISAASTGIGMYQAQQSMKFQAASARQQQDLSYRQAQQQQRFQNEQIVNKHIGQVKAQQAASNAANMAWFYGDQSANKAWISQQQKFNEVKDKAAFKSQTILAKMIGSKGKVLASGATGQSVGLLALDAERRGGFAQAEQDATVRSAEMAMGNSMETTRIKALSNANKIGSMLDFPVQAPQLSPQPIGIGKDLELGIPAYNWA